MSIAGFLASTRGRTGRVVVGSLLATASILVGGISGQLLSVSTLLPLMVGAEIAVGGALNICILCPLFGLPPQGSKLHHGLQGPIDRSQVATSRMRSAGNLQPPKEGAPDP